MRKQLEALINSEFNANQVANETGLPRNTVYRIFSGEAKLDNISLKNAEILANYWEGKTMLGWKTIQSENFKSVKVLCEYGKVSVYAQDFDDSKTYAYVKTWLNEDCSAVVRSDKVFVPDNFEYFSEEQKQELREIAFKYADELCVWKYEQYYD